MYQGTLKTYLDDLAARKSTPGGGSAAALAGAVGAALLSMVANFTIGKERYLVFEDEIKKVLASTEALRGKLLKLVDEDVESYKKVTSAYRMPKVSPDDRKNREQAIQQGLKSALRTSLEVCRCCYQAIKLCSSLVEKGNVNLVSDVGVAVVLLEGAFQSALLNIEINLISFKDLKDKDPIFINEVRGVIEPALKGGVAALRDEVWRKVKDRMLQH